MFSYAISSTLSDSLSIVRASLRLLLLKVTRRPLVSSPIPEREFDPTMLASTSNASSPTLAPSTPPLSTSSTPDHLRNNLVPLPPHPLLKSAQADISAEDYLLPKALTTSSVKPSVLLIRPFSSLRDWSAEIIYILRPLIYGTSIFIGENIYVTCL